MKTRNVINGRKPLVVNKSKVMSLSRQQRFELKLVKKRRFLEVCILKPVSKIKISPFKEVQDSPISFAV